MNRAAGLFLIGRHSPASRPAWLLPALFSFLLICGSGCGDPQAENANGTAPGDSAGASALADLTDRIDAAPGQPDLLQDRARIYIRNGEFKKALDDMVAAVRIDSTKPEYYLTLSDIFFATNRTFDAKDALERCLRYEPGNDEARSKLAEIFFIVRKYKLAMEHTIYLLDKNPENTRALFIQGMIYKETGDTASAINRFQRVIETDDRFYNAYMQLGVLYTARENPVCVEYFTGALQLKPGSEEALYGRALWYQEHDELDKALQDYTSIVQINPSNRNAHFNLGYVHYTYLKVYDQAIRHYSDAIAADPSYAEAYFNRGLCYEALGNLESAASDYDRSVALRPGYELAIQGLERVQQLRQTVPN